LSSSRTTGAVSRLDLLPRPLDGRGGPTQRLVAVKTSLVPRVVAKPHSVRRKAIRVRKLIRHVEAVVLEELKQPIDVVGVRKLNPPKRQHSLQGLLDRLLGVETKNGVGDAFNRQQRSRGELIVTRSLKQHLWNIDLIGHQAAKARPSDSAA
jgi:hypothetical protein